VAGRPRKRRPAAKLPPGVRLKVLADGQPLYESKVKFPDAAGKLTVARYCYGSTLEELAIAKGELLKQRKAAPKRQRARRGEDPAKMTIRDLAERWMERHVIKQAESTDDYYRIALTYRVAPYLYDKKVGELTRRDVEEWMTDLLLEPLRDAQGNIVHDENGDVVKRHGARSINAGLAALKAMYGKAIDWEIVKSNPCQRVKKLDEHKKAIRIYEPGEVQRIAAQFYEIRRRQSQIGRGQMQGTRADRLAARDATMTIVLGFCGLRLGELCGLQFHHYDDGRERDMHGNIVRDREVGWLIVEQQVNQRTGKIGPVKGKRDRRVPLLRSVRDAIDWYIAALPTREPDAFLFPAMWSSDPAKWGYLKHGKWRDNLFKQAAGEAGFPKAIPHEMRHTFASLIIEYARGRVSTLRLAGWLGHADAGLVERLYGHIYARVEADLLSDVNTALFFSPPAPAEVADAGAARRSAFEAALDST
jgi:integrase